MALIFPEEPDLTLEEFEKTIKAMTAYDWSRHAKVPIVSRKQLEFIKRWQEGNRGTDTGA